MCRRAKITYRVTLSLIILLIASFRTFYGQNFTLRSYATKDGLPHNNVRAIVRDSTGFIWLGTWDGLSRFDGHEFKNYYHKTGDSTSLPFFSVNTLVVDKNNNLWILTDRGELARYNPSNDKFKLYRQIDGASVEKVLNINTDKYGDLWLLTTDNAIKWDDKRKISEISHFTNKEKQPIRLQNKFFSTTIFDNSELWITDHDSTNKFRKTGDNTFRLEREFPVIRSPKKRTIYFDYLEWSSVYISESGSEWIFSNYGLFKLDESTGSFRECRDEIPLKEFTGKDFFVWAWQDNGIYIYLTKTRELLHLPPQLVKQPYAVLPSLSKSMWFSNATHLGEALGLTQVVFTPEYFHNNIFSEPDSATPAVYSVVTDRYNNVWTGIRGYDHIVIFDTYLRARSTDYLTPDQMSASGHIRSMIPVHNGIWIGYFMNRLEFYDYNTGRFIIHHPDANGFRAIAVKEDGNIYIGTDKLSLYYPETGKTKILWKADWTEVTYKIFPDNNGLVWAGLSKSKLLKYDTKTGKAEIIRLPVESCTIEDIIPGENGDLWLALLGEGVGRYNYITGSFRNYSTSDGLSNNTAYGLLKDRSGNIWVSTNKGISRINMLTELIRTFGITDGLAITEFNSGARSVTGDGEFFFGGMGGYVRFYPDSISHEEKSGEEQKIILTGMEVSGEVRHFQRALNAMDTIVLGKGEKDFHLTFATTDFINSDKTIFRYKLSGINKEWIETDNTNRNINYTNLHPGWYSLLIEATDINGNWTISKNIILRISPYFFERKLFIVSISLLISTIILLIIIIYIRQVRQKEIQKQDELKLQTLRGQMNPHFIFNSLNSINYFISNNDRLSANRYIADFSSLIRSILANLGRNYIPFEQEINSINDYLRIEHLRFSDKFDYEIKTDEIANPAEIEICPGIAQPFIENAIWHGVRPLENRKGLIKIIFSFPLNDRIKCFIEDDGVGFESSVISNARYQNHKSRGISIVKERLQITGKINRTIYNLEIKDLYNDRTEKGTKVIVDIPVKTLKKTQS